MYPRIPWEMVADPLRSAEHTLGTAAIDFKSVHYVKCCMTECPVQGSSKCRRVTARFVSSQQMPNNLRLAVLYSLHLCNCRHMEIRY
jgi:hypothetical protein